MTGKKGAKFNTMRLIAGGFLSTIFLGGLLLWLPVCNTKPIAFIDALFTATTAVCVTGLVTVVPATQFTLVGKIILLILIQIGGLGVIACTVAFFVVLKRKITMKERVVIQETYNMSTLSGLVNFVLRIVKGTFLVEGIGAVCYAFQFVPEYGVLKGIWYSVFHSVSAFCNAGIDILGDSSFIKYAGNPIINFTTMGLIIVAGIGFTVWHDIAQNIRIVAERKLSYKRVISRLSLHSKIAIVMTAFLIVFGAINFFLMEYSNPATMGNMSLWEKIMASLFHSVSTRTAGFATVPQASLHGESMFVTILLMFIGGSPGGTAGGVKTTTVAMLVLTCIAILQGKEDTECFGRKIPLENLRTGFIVVMTAAGVWFAGTAALMVLESDVSFIRILYETTSAVGTVGLTADLTPTLGGASKCIIMAMMYIGRIGPVTMALVFGKKKNPADQIRKLPEQRIMVG